MTEDVRFWSKVDVTRGCWLWMGARDGNGYGRFYLPPKTVYAHRRAYELRVGPIPTELVLDHLCRNPACVNPAHLEAVTMGENIRRGETGQIRGRQMSARSQCSLGHPYTPENTARRGDGKGRMCRVCRRAAVRRYRARKAVPA